MHNLVLPDLSPWYKDEYTVYHKDIDFRSEFRLSSLLTFFQESAWNHAKVLGIDYSNAGFSDKHWVMSRLKLVLSEAQPEWMSKVQVATYPSGVDKMFANRDFVVYDQQNRVFAHATSSWLIINAETRQLCRPEALISQIPLETIEKVLPEGPSRLKEEEMKEDCGKVRASYAEIDAHHHVNNVCYAQWCLSSFDQAFFDTWRLKSFEVSFTSEASWGDELRILRNSEYNNAELLTSFNLQKANSKAAALLKYIWEKRSV